MSSLLGPRSFIAALAVIFVAAAPAAAQSLRDLSVGYSFLWLQDDDEAPGGWQVTYSREITPVLRWIADFGGHYGAESAIHTFQGGLRFGLTRTEPVVPFADLAFGGAYGVQDENGDSKLGFVAQFGAGLDFPFRPGGPGMRVAVHVPVILVGDDPEETVRLTVGFVIPIK